MVCRGGPALPNTLGWSGALSDCSDTSHTSELDDQPQSNIFDFSNGSPINIQNLTFVHYNVDSILAEGRLDELTHVCNIMSIDCLLISESHLDESVPTNLISIPGYHEPVRRDRTVNGRMGGGCLVYVSEKLTFKPKPELQSDHFEHIWVDIHINKSVYAVNIWYRPPNTANHDLFLTESEHILTKLQTYNAHNKIIMSDFNYGNIYCKYPPLPDKPLDSSAPELFESFGFHQILDIPTRTTDTTASLVDLIYVQNQDYLTCHGTLPKIADHDGTLVAFHCTRHHPKARTRTIYDYNKLNELELIKYIKDFDFQNKIFSHPLSDQPQLLTDMLTTTFGIFVPSKQVTIRPNEPAWTNTYTRLLQRRKNRNYSFFKKTTSDYFTALNNPNISINTTTQLLNRKNRAHLKSTESRNESTYANKRAKNSFFYSVNSVMTNPHISAKKKFGILTKLMKNQKVSTIPPLVEENCTITDAKQKADLLNSHFASKSTVSGADDAPPVLEKLPVLSELNYLNTSSIEISKIVRSMKKSSQSHCGIPGKFLSLIATPISFPLSTLFNNLFSEGIFPDVFKLAHITAIWKQKGLKSSKNFYRPISLLPTLSKVCESVIHQRLLAHLTENNLISNRQAAFIKGDSTTNQLIYLVHLIRTSWSAGHHTQGVFLDVEAAFDKVWHSGLLAKLDQNGITGPCLALFRSYLSNRKQVVVVDGVKSEVQPVQAGVPQGSRLGPLLFIIFMNDIKNNLESEVLIFADDTTLLASGLNTEQTSSQLNRDLTKIQLWSSTWKVKFNAEKSKNMVFSNKQLLNIPTILFNNTNIERVTSHRHLGVYLTTSLDWSLHVHHICLRASRKLAVLRSVKELSRSTLDLLYKLTVRSLIDYALPLYYGTLNQSLVRRLNLIQYRAAKLVTGALHLSSSIKLDHELGWESLEKRYDCLGLILFHKIHLNLTRPLIKTFMPEINYHELNTRHKFMYKPFPFKNKSFSNSFFPSFTKKWIALPAEVRIENDMTEFKNKIKDLFRPTKFKFFSRTGNKRGESLMTQLRVGRSYLNDHRFPIGQSETAACTCHSSPRETSKHILLKCNLYTSERQILLGKVKQLSSSFNSLPEHRQFDILLSGIYPDNRDYYYKNTQLQRAVQHFLLSTNRFD